MKFNKYESAKLLDCMNTVIRYLNDEDGIELWLMNGVADGDGLYEIIEYFGEDDKENSLIFNDMCDLFFRIIISYGKEGWFVPRKLGD